MQNGPGQKFIKVHWTLAIRLHNENSKNTSECKKCSWDSWHDWFMPHHDIDGNVVECCYAAK